MRRICFLIIFIITTFLLLPYKALDKSVVICKNGKSSGEFYSVSTFKVSDYLCVDGVSFNISKSEIDGIIEKLNAKLVYTFSDGEITSYYYYSPKISKKEKIFEKPINVHIAVTQEKVIFGSPIIYYGY